MGDIGQRIRMLREQKGMTQEELALKCGYKSRASINKIELKRDAPIKKLVPIAYALGITPAELMGWESDDPVVNDIAAAILEHDDKPTAEEMELVRAYRSADELTKQMVLRLLKV